MSVKVYLDEDADLLDLQKKVCAVIGFGWQGHAHALNLRDSGIEVIVGLYPGSKSIPIAKEYGFLVLDVSEAGREADVIFFATPDLRIAEIYEKQVGRHPESRKNSPSLFSLGGTVTHIG
jgi:ketol-acid reductoisomerase